MEASTDVDGSYRRDAYKFVFHGLPLYLHGRFHFEASARLPSDFHSTSKTSIWLPFNFQKFHFDFLNFRFGSRMEVLEAKIEVLEVEWESNGNRVEAFIHLPNDEEVDPTREYNPYSQRIGDKTISVRDNTRAHESSGRLGPPHVCSCVIFSALLINSLVSDAV